MCRLYTQLTDRSIYTYYELQIFECIDGSTAVTYITHFTKQEAHIGFGRNWR